MENKEEEINAPSGSRTVLLSVLIPNYNCDCRALIQELSRQASAIGGTEIIVADDCSTLVPMADAVAEEARRLGCRYMAMERNSGRAAVRNALAEAAQGQYLLFIDSDAMPAQSSFLSDYARMAGQADVVCGTVLSPDECPSAEVSLRWVYDHTSMPLFKGERRQRRPYDCFSSFCFMVRRDVFLGIRFDESIRGYGYEDTLFGHALKQAGASIAHRDIGCFHLGLEPNAVFLSKVESSNQTLLRHADKIGDASSLLRMAKKLRRWSLIRPTDFLFRRFAETMRRRLTLSQRPSYKLLQFYKLAHLCHLIALDARG